MKNQCCSQDCEQGRNCPNRLKYTLNAFAITVAVIVWAGISVFISDAIASTTQPSDAEQAQVGR